MTHPNTVAGMKRDLSGLGGTERPSRAEICRAVYSPAQGFSALSVQCGSSSDRISTSFRNLYSAIVAWPNDHARIVVSGACSRLQSSSIPRCFSAISRPRVMSGLGGNRFIAHYLARLRDACLASFERMRHAPRIAVFFQRLVGSPASPTVWRTSRTDSVPERRQIGSWKRAFAGLHAAQRKLLDQVTLRISCSTPWGLQRCAEFLRGLAGFFFGVTCGSGFIANIRRRVSSITFFASAGGRSSLRLLMRGV